MTLPSVFFDLPPQVRSVHLDVDTDPVDCERCGQPACVAVGWRPHHSAWFGLLDVCADCVSAAVDTAIADTGPDDDIIAEFFTQPEGAA